MTFLRRTSLMGFFSLIAAVLALGLPTTASAATIDEIGAELRADYVFNDPAAENALTTAQTVDLQTQIAGTGLPIYIAVLPESMAVAAGGPDALLVDIRDAVGRGGVYAIIAGSAFRAGGTDYSVTGIADSAFAAQASNGPYAVLEAFVAGVDAAYGTGSGGGSGGATASGGASGLVLLIIFAVIVVVIVVVVWLARRSARKRREIWAAQMREVLDEDITELGERLGRFDLSDDRLDQAGRDHLQSALDSYARAGDSSARLATEADVMATTKALDDGRYSLALVEARMNGEEEPLRRAPCFFDPRHGVSLDDVMWTPQVGHPHPVPACAACSATVTAGGYPEVREVEVAGGVRRPYWDAGPAYAPYARGYFSDFGTTMVAVFAGTMLANAFFAPTAAAATFGGGAYGSDPGGGGFGGGDFGGGGFGGGDFGGGGFGGGDF